MKIILIGGGGHCKSCIDVIEQEGKYELFGILDVKEKIGDKILNYEIIGTDDDLEKYCLLGYYFLVTIGQIKTAEVRKKIYDKLESMGAKIGTVISPLAYVSKHAIINKGTIVMHKAFVNVGAKVAENCILNTGCIIEHNAEIGKHTHISTNAVINGDCTVGSSTFVGSNATISSQLHVGSMVVIGAGSVVINTIENNICVAGVPAKKIK